MWLLTSVVRGSKHFDADSRIDNQVLICDTGELVISGRSFGTNAYRFEARKGNESFTVVDFPTVEPGASLSVEFGELAQRLGAVGAPPRR
jgi:hypothetical protein